ncbi:hypothetical protein DFJ74DRAFT_695486 [Hyaloraphidium curvatum]|nr:hypothetical protein DFJ74DRAFT_695486 [Hyaloraphidium curvatum]
MDRLFSAAEQLALFPPAMAPPKRLSSRLGVADGASSGSPLTSSALLAGLESRLLRGTVAVQLAVAPAFVSWLVQVQMAGGLLLWIPVGAWTVIAGQNGPFSPRTIGVGVACVALYWSVCVAMAFSGALFRGRFFVPRAASDLGAHPLAVFARYNQLVRATPEESGGKDGAAGSEGIVRHVDGDPLCPCPAKACARNLEGRAGTLRLFDLILRVLLVSTAIFFMGYTPVVTLAAATWSTPWAAAFTAAYVAWLQGASVAACLASSSGSLPALELQQRLQSRALSDALSELLDRYAAAIEDASRTDGDLRSTVYRLPTEESYEALCERLQTFREGRFSTFSVSRNLIISYFLVPFVAGVAAIAAGSCVPLWCPLVLLFFFFLALRDLLAVAAANAQVSTTQSLLRRAHREAESILARASATPGGPPPGPAAALGHHAALLAAYAGDASAVARFLGFAADWGSARAVAATLLTVAVGLWSVLRSAGVYLTPDVACWA